MDIHITNKINKSCEAAYVIKVRQLFSKHRVSRIVSSAYWRAVQAGRNVMCCAVR